MKKHFLVFSSSVTIKSLSFLVLLTTGILLGIELMTSANINRLESQTLDNYHRSVQSYCGYWDEKLEIINNTLIQLTLTTNEDMAYWKVCQSEETLDFEVSKTMLMRSMSEIARNHQNQIQLFCYVPQRSVYLKSVNHLLPMAERKGLDEAVRQYVARAKQTNTTEWSCFFNDGDAYLINLFAMHGGYIGALVPFSTIMQGITDGDGIAGEAILTDEAGHVIAALKNDASDSMGRYTFEIDMPHLEHSLSIRVLEQQLTSDSFHIIMLSLATVALGVLLLVGNIVFQMKFVLGPLTKLRKAMEKFSRGEFDTRLAVDHRNNEINVLFRTFNEMIEQISNLKIQVYESRLEQERVQSNYMRVQIQPHFYANVLTLIYGLAQVKNYKAIQKLAQDTSRYFRYLMGEKGTFVALKEEINCVLSYVEIQKMRYQGCIEFSLEAQEGLENQLVLPMVLQTFVANSFKHNVTLVPLLHVQARIYEKASQICFEIEDDGEGFPPEVLEKVQRGESLEAEGNHIGILNVQQRLKLMYAEQAALKIESEKGRTLVVITFPKLAE